MKFEASIIVGWGAIASAASISRRDGPPAFPKANNAFDMLERVAPNIKPVSVINEKPRLRPEALRKRIRFGPYTLPAAKVRL
jgi:hypothetical protein